jgi:hypothetical protein
LTFDNNRISAILIIAKRQVSSISAILIIVRREVISLSAILIIVKRQVSSISGNSAHLTFDNNQYS